MARLQDRVAVVTGAATGLGRVYALRLAYEGAHVCVADINLEGVEKTISFDTQDGYGPGDAYRQWYGSPAATLWRQSVTRVR